MAHTPITWKNITAPNFGASNALLQSAAKTGTDAINSFSDNLLNVAATRKDNRTDQAIATAYGYDNNQDLLGAKADLLKDPNTLKGLDASAVLAAYSDQRKSNFSNSASQFEEDTRQKAFDLDVAASEAGTKRDTLSNDSTSITNEFVRENAETDLAIGKSNLERNRLLNEDTRTSSRFLERKLRTAADTQDAILTGQRTQNDLGSLNLDEERARVGDVLSPQGRVAAKLLQNNAIKEALFNGEVLDAKSKNFPQINEAAIANVAEQAAILKDAGVVRETREAVQAFIAPTGKGGIGAYTKYDNEKDELVYDSVSFARDLQKVAPNLSQDQVQAIIASRAVLTKYSDQVAGKQAAAEQLGKERLELIKNDVDPETGKLIDINSKSYNDNKGKPGFTSKDPIINAINSSVVSIPMNDKSQPSFNRAKAFAFDVNSQGGFMVETQEGDVRIPLTINAIFGAFAAGQKENIWRKDANTDNKVFEQFLLKFSKNEYDRNNKDLTLEQYKKSNTDLQARLNKYERDAAARVSAEGNPGNFSTITQ